MWKGWSQLNCSTTHNKEFGSSGAADVDTAPASTQASLSFYTERFRGAPPAICLSILFFGSLKKIQCEFSFEIIIEMVTTTHKLHQHPQSINCSAFLFLSHTTRCQYRIEYWARSRGICEKQQQQAIINKCNEKTTKQNKMCYKHA